MHCSTKSTRKTYFNNKHVRVLNRKKIVRGFYTNWKSEKVEKVALKLDRETT